MNNVGDLSNLSVRLHQVEKQYAADRSGICDSRLSVVNAAEGYRRSRYRLGESLSKYKSYFVEQRGWLVAAKVIADALGCDERTIRRIVSDFDRVAGVPAAVIRALEQAGIDPAARRNATIIDRILRMPHKDCATDAMESNLAEPAIRDRSFLRREHGSLTQNERCRLTLRKRIRTALQKTPSDLRLSVLLAAVEEEMYLEWGSRDPITVTITPRSHTDERSVREQRMVA